ncbi:Rv3235 family protein [Rothia sp. LK2588]|uniref:Rv3235 family protein n=1 Tax=Rothia sp. LK2588 TaxID=3114369 RepID=UPI0034D01529
MKRPSTTMENQLIGVSLQEYERFREKVMQRELKVCQGGRPLAPSDSECRSIEVMCSGLSVAILEIFAGQRSVNHIAKWLSHECYAKIVNRSAVTQKAMRRQRRGSPLGHAPLRSSDVVRPSTRRVRAQKINPSVFEVCIIVEDFARVRAMALRVEKIFSAWKITAIEIA